MENFWDSSVWGTYLVIGILLVSILVAHMLKRSIPLLQKSLIPTSVLGGALIVLIHLVSLRSMGVAYLSRSGSILRRRLIKNKFRTPKLHPKDRRNQR